MSVASNVTRTSAWFPVVLGSPVITFSSREAVDFAGSPFESGVPTVSVLELCAVGLHEPYVSGAPCVRLGAVHCLYDGSSDARNGVAPRGRTYESEVLAR